MIIHPRRIMLQGLLAVLVSSPLLSQWSEVEIEMAGVGSPYRCWHKSEDNSRVDDVIYLDSLPGGFCDQVFTWPHVEYNQSGNTALIMAAGDAFQGGFGDSVGMIVRRQSDGYFDTNPVPDPVSQTSLVMHFPHPTNCAPPGFACNWTWSFGRGGCGFHTHADPDCGGLRLFCRR